MTIQSMLYCTYCHITFGGVENIVYDNGQLFHQVCHKKYERENGPYPYACPVCETRGWNWDENNKEKYLRKAGPDETPDCAWSGCRGCPQCGMITDTRPVKVKCEFCEGRGYVAKEPVAVTGVVRWEHGK